MDITLLEMIFSLIRWFTFHVITAIIGIAIVRHWIDHHWALGIFIIMVINLIDFNVGNILGIQADVGIRFFLTSLSTLVSVVYTIDLLGYAITHFVYDQKQAEVKTTWFKQLYKILIQLWEKLYAI